MLEDRVLILKFKYGNPDALRRIYEKYRLYLLKIAVALLQDVSAAENVVHDVFLRLARSGDSLSVQGSLKAFLRICVINAIRNRIRDEQIRACASLDDADTQATSSDGVTNWVILQEDAQRVRDALQEIPFEQREVVVLHIYGHMTFRAIAQTAGCFH